MENVNTELIEAGKEKFLRFRELVSLYGEDMAIKTMLDRDGLPELQKKRMGPFLCLPSLAEGFLAALPFFNAIGMKMEVVDISNQGIDAVLEIQRFCPWLELSKEFGFETPCRMICEMDMMASAKVFPELKGVILCRIAEGSSVCIFKYERKAKTEPETDSQHHDKSQP